MISYRTPFKFPVRYKQESGLHIENEFLFSLYENIVKSTADLRIAMQTYYHKSRLMNFPNHTEYSVKEKELSHDQILSYSSYSYQNGWDAHKRLWNEVKYFKIRGRFLSPRDWIYLGLLNYDFRAILLVPLLYLMFIITSINVYKFEYFEGDIYIKKKSSSMMLWLLRLHTVRKNALLRTLLLPIGVLHLVSSLLRYKGQNGLIMEYFQNDENHPIVEQLTNSKWYDMVII